MTAEHLIRELSNMDKDKVVILTDPSGITWTNIGTIEECAGTIKIKEDDNCLFHES